MAGVFEQLFRPRRTAISDRRAMELDAAREILAEVFGIGLSDVDEMICSRFKAGDDEQGCQEEDGLWPQELWVEG